MRLDELGKQYMQVGEEDRMLTVDIAEEGTCELSVAICIMVSSVLDLCIFCIGYSLTKIRISKWHVQEIGQFSNFLFDFSLSNDEMHFKFY